METSALGTAVQELSGHPKTSTLLPVPPQHPFTREGPQGLFLRTGRQMRKASGTLQSNKPGALSFFLVFDQREREGFLGLYRSPPPGVESQPLGGTC